MTRKQIRHGLMLAADLKDIRDAKPNAVVPLRTSLKAISAAQKRIVIGRLVRGAGIEPATSRV